jgi:hypothetical protein
VKRWLWALISAGVLVLVALAWVYPQRMVSPGALMQDHAELEKDCFACHAPWRGAAAPRCVKCHGLPDIGLRTTRGVLIPQRTLKASFHPELIEQDCIACHGDHEGPKLAERSRKPFSHPLLRVAVRARCEDCHAAPGDNIHRDLTATCGRCHQPEHWKPARFDHQLLATAEQQRCGGCHKPPADTLHRQVRGNCSPCNSQARWKPATFDHDKLFVLDADHSPPCATCHNGEDLRRYTCYGCHAHRPDPVRAKHLEEGIRNFENCVKCHRSARGEPEGGESRD